MTIRQAPGIMSGEAARASLIRGMQRMAALLRPTLGPLPRTVAIGRMVGSDPPEILDSGATIARRTLQLADPYQDMGAMLIRHLAWRVFEQAGDGTATAAVIAESLTRSAFLPDANPVSVRRGLERAASVASAELQRQARAIDGPDQIASLVRPMVGTRELADMLGEVVDAAGPDGAILVENAHETRTTHEYVDGVRWNEGFVSSFLLPDDELTTMRAINPRVLLTDHVLERADDLVPVLEACIAAGERSLFIVAPEIKDSAVGLLVLNRKRGVLDAAIAVGAPSVGTQRQHILQDLAVITGGRFISHERSDRLADVSVSDLGKARQAWATRVAFGILGGYGNKADIRRRIGEAKAELSSVPPDDVFSTSKIRERIGKLAGTTAVVRVGAPTSAEQEELKLRIEAAVLSARSALQDGVVPGGGAALLRCIPAIHATLCDGDEAVGVRSLAQALAEPMRVILHNAGLPVASIVDASRRSEKVYDVMRRDWVDAWAVGLVDPLKVQLTALETAVSTAAVALTSEVLVHRKNPPSVVRP